VKKNLAQISFFWGRSLQDGSFENLVFFEVILSIEFEKQFLFLKKSSNSILSSSR
jgi:hypothetical protein